MTWYLSIVPVQEPFDLAELDDEGRVQYAFTVDVQKRPGGTVLGGLIGVLQLAGVGEEQVNIFASSLAAIPRGPGPYLSLRETPGPGPLGTHNDGIAAYRRPRVQVLVRGASTQAVSAMAHAAYEALAGVRNQAVPA